MIKKILILAIVSVTLFSCGSKTRTKREAREIVMGTETPDFTAFNIETVHTEDAIPKNRLKAKVQMRYKNGNERYPEGIDIVTFDEEDLSESSHLVADSAIYTADSTLYTVYGNVVLDDYKKGQKLETDTLHFNKENGDIFTDDRVKITTEDEIVTGKGMRANQNNPEEYEILDIEGSVFVE
ncbi:LPS export ABC transporter periplasmic protein LptC [Flammeovirga kamogawensis]|uniref:LPS export ABC transporter periplasmic protein LptC n=1 Tax=Flammeovirga kamogawensis TaxID=373891 RepID=A0ABX8GZX7_9BACT|nr:LPS export ABC transporter periplasmic protein LptC [Flammeovirga kamogawensis]MBB6459402.1 LPS export ABC transporter protein LptC [Flammeovirga kamogawensis]QWG08958.1 LPS export ABC transporter periplasmic protein LptC [Flammeovirga kamogawensis]TRX67248.1 LPS export ABC transporter periplasmic protein LptC [Flammeovirga kamogawensis]